MELSLLLGGISDSWGVAVTMNLPWSLNTPLHRYRPEEKLCV